jgi:hypothetical protein
VYFVCNHREIVSPTIHFASSTNKVLFLFNNKMLPLEYTTTCLHLYVGEFASAESTTCFHQNQKNMDASIDLTLVAMYDNGARAEAGEA